MISLHKSQQLLRSLQKAGASSRSYQRLAQSTWTRAAAASASKASNRRLRSHAPHWRVNGKPVAMHINDLKQLGEQPLSYEVEAPPIEIKPIREYESDLVVVLDMDECLIHSQFLQNSSAKYAYQVQKFGSVGKSSVDTFTIRLPNGDEARVHERPHLHEFLARVSEKYETHIFTAAMEVYAKPVLKRLDPHNTIFTKCWYRESCQMDKNFQAYVKNLEPMWTHNLKRTVLVDNNPLSFLPNPDNGILVSHFYDDPKDQTLPVVLDLLHELNEEEDVRPVLDARFGLKRALEKIMPGKPFQGEHHQVDKQEHEEEAEEEEQEAQYLSAAASS